MDNIFRADQVKASSPPKITDSRGRDIFESAMESIVDTATASKLFETAEQHRLGSFCDRHSAAYDLAIAFRMAEKDTIRVNGDSEDMSAAKIFHWAGHSFRDIGQLNRAGDAYWRAGVMSGTKQTPDTFGVRSLARAKTSYAEVGDFDESDRMHYLEWEARRQQKKVAPLLYVWKMTSNYGTSFSRWLLSCALFVVVFALAYQLLYSTGSLCVGHDWVWFLTAIYYCVVTTATVGFGEIVPTNGISQTVVALNINSSLSL